MTQQFFALFIAVNLPLAVFQEGAAQEPAASAQPAKVREEFRSRLEYGKATYTSIFGLIPKEGPLELEEERVIVTEQVPGSPEIRILPTESKVRRVLRIPEELPLLENEPKPLTGREVQLRLTDGRWVPHIVGVENPTPSEAREAGRLAARFSPDASPFAGLSWDDTSARPVDLGKLLPFLGYNDPQEILGEAKLGGPATPSEDSSAANDPSVALPVSIETSFSMGADKEKVGVELKAVGAVSRKEDQGDFHTLTLKGDLLISGRRDLADGRRVPFNVIAEFTYKVERTVVAGE